MKNCSDFLFRGQILLIVAFARSERIAPKQSLAVPESQLRQPGAKAARRIRSEMIRRVRRNEDHIACRKLELRTILKTRSAPRDNISDDGWNHAPRRCLTIRAKLDKTAGQRAERRHGVAAEHAR